VVWCYVQFVAGGRRILVGSGGVWSGEEFEEWWYVCEDEGMGWRGE
jgi:hypothetical protein